MGPGRWFQDPARHACHNLCVQRTPVWEQSLNNQIFLIVSRTFLHPPFNIATYECFSACFKQGVQFQWKNKPFSDEKKGHSRSRKLGFSHEKRRLADEKVKRKTELHALAQRLIGMLFAICKSLVKKGEGRLMACTPLRACIKFWRKT